jgi:hypothetical protein
VAHTVSDDFLLSSGLQGGNPRATAMPSSAASGFSLDILSASSFQDTFPNARKPAEERPSTRILYGGIMVDDDDGSEYHDENASHTTPDPRLPDKKDGPSRKKGKKRTGPGLGPEDEDPSKKRGRPRLDTTDETAAEVCMNGGACPRK